MQDITPVYSKNANNMKKSAIRELLKLTQKPDIISFAGGLPDPATFPVEDLRIAADAVFRKNAASAFQYGTTEGDKGLKSALIDFEAAGGIKIGHENLLVTSASQQSLDMLPKVFLDPGDCVIAGRPTYLGAIQAIQSYQGKVIGIPFSMDNDGFDMLELEKRYKRARERGEKIKYIYVIPDFQNPTGICWSLKKRNELLEFSYRENLVVAEDSPYREIRFIGEPVPSLYQLDQEGERRGNILNLKTFSKILAPGTRVGWIMGREDILQKFVTAKQAMDLCTSPFTQMVLAEYIASGKLPDRIRQTCALYLKKRNYMTETLDKYMPKRFDLRWTRPEGGLFLWVTLPHYIDSNEMFYRALEKKVAYVSSTGFYYDEPENNAMRLNFSYSSFEQIDEGIKRLAETISGDIAGHEAGPRGQTTPEGI